MSFQMFKLVLEKAEEPEIKLPTSAGLLKNKRVPENSGSWWWTGRPGVLRFMGLQRVGHDWATELNWNYGEGNEDNGDLPQKMPGMHCYTKCPQPCRKPLPIHASTRDSQSPTGMSGHSSILARRIPWTDDPGWLQSMGLQRVRYDWMTELVSKSPFLFRLLEFMVLAKLPH